MVNFKFISMHLLRHSLFLLLSFFFSTLVLYSQDKLFEEYKNLFTPPKGYVATFASTPLVIDGKIDDTEWQNAEWTDLFVDIEGDLKPMPYNETRAKIMWDNDYLYIAAKMIEPHVWAKLTKRDEIVFFDNDFEIFLNPNNTTHQYFEIEINALNNIFDLYMNKPYREGSGALFSWDSQGMKHAVHIDGTLNDATDTDEYWSVEFAIPWRALTVGNDVHVPKDGELWRMNFSRVQWDTQIIDGDYVKCKDEKGQVKPENNWVWSPQGLIDMHRPERWGYLQFSTNTTQTDTPKFSRPYEEKMRDYLWLIYYKQKAYKDKHSHYAKTLKELGMPTEVVVENKKSTLSLEATKSLFLATMKNNEVTININNEGLIWK